MAGPARSAPILFLVLALAPAPLGAWSFANVIDTSGPYSEFTPPSIDSAGNAAFRAKLDGGGQAILVASPTGGDVVADTAGPYDVFGTLVNLADDQTAFFYAEGQVDPGWYTGPNPLTDAIDPFESEVPVADAAGNVVARATIAGKPGLYRGSIAIVDVDDDEEFELFGRPALNDTGTVAFQARTASLLGTAVYTVGLDGGGLALVADTDGPFSAFFEKVAINDAGAVVFQAGLDALPSESSGGIFTGPDPATDTVVDTSGPFDLLDDPVITENGTVLFWGAHAAGGGIYEGPDPDTDRVIGSFDPLFGSTVTGVNMRSEGYANGRLAFSYGLLDGRSGIAIAYAPEPTGVAGAALACVVWRGARARRRAT